jgi:hypothetical protein
MKPVSTACFILGLLALGCTPPVVHSNLPKVTFTEKDVSLIIAKRASNDLGATGISDRQVFDGKIFVFATFHWADLTYPAGEQELEFRWYSGEKWVSSYKKIHKFTVAPYYAWASTSVTNIGLGKGRVELYYQGNRIASKDFELFESKMNPLLSRP